MRQVQKGKPLVMVFTHSDFDHILGYGAFDPNFVIAHHNFFKNPKKDKILQEIHDFDAKMYIKRDYELKYPEKGIEITSDNQVVSFGNTNLHFYPALGHTDDSIFLIIEPLKLLLVGDYLSNIEFPFIYYSLDEYRKTVDKISLILERHPIQTMIPGHGDIATSVDAIKTRLMLDNYYLEYFIKFYFDFENFLKYYPFPDGLHDEHLANLRKWFMSE